jgi:hypothetical protein
MLKKLLVTPLYLTFGVLAIIICSFVSIYEIFTLK